MALAGDPRLLLLDEPMAGMGAEESQRMVELLRGAARRSTRMLLVEHDMDAVFALADRITVLVYGRVIAIGHAGRDPRQRRGAPGLSRRRGRIGLRCCEVARRSTAFYGASQVLFGMELAVDAGEVVDPARPQRHGQDDDRALDHGPAAGRRGTVEFDGPRVERLPAFRIARLGIGLVPEGRQIFPNLSVRENLVAAAANRGRRRPAPWTLARVLELFPRLRRAPAQPRQPALGRRAADAGDRPRADDQPAAADPRRGDRGPGAAGPRGDLGLPGAAASARARPSW